MTITYLYWFLCGLIVGAILGMVCAKLTGKQDGVIHVTRKPPGEADRYLFEFNIAPEVIPEMKNVIFRVKLEPDDGRGES